MPPNPESTPWWRNLFKAGGVSKRVVSDAAKFAWPWMREIFDMEFPKVPLLKRILLLLSSLIIINQSRAEIVEKAKILYGYLPSRMGQLRGSRIKARGYLKKARTGTWSDRLFLIGYIPALKALILATGVKLANSLTRPNRWGWKDQRAYRLFVALQINLAKIRRPIYFVTLTYEGTIHYDDVREHLKSFREDTFDRLGYQSMAVIAFGTHTKYQQWRHKRYHSSDDPKVPRLHCHLMMWPFYDRGEKEEQESYQGLKRIIEERRHGIGGEYDLEIMPTIEDFLKVCSYVVLNYCGSVMIDRKNDTCPIPSGSNPLTTPREILPGRPWQKIGELSLVTPYTIAWRDAVGRYAKERGYDSSNSMGWIHFETENIKEIMEPEQWRDASITGLDGYNYRVAPTEAASNGTERYLLLHPERPTYTISEKDLSRLGTLGAFPGALHVRPDFHPLYGEAQPRRVEGNRKKSSLLPRAVIGVIGIALIGVALWQLFKRKI